MRTQWIRHTTGSGYGAALLLPAVVLIATAALAQLPRPFDVLRYRCDLTLAMTDERLGGTQTIVLLLRSPTRDITLNAAALRLDAVRMDGNPAPFTNDAQSESFTVDCGQMRQPGDTIRIEVDYARDPAVLRQGSRRGYYFFADSIGLPANLGYTMSEPSDARFWMPCYDEPWDKAMAEFLVTVPRGYTVASNGRLVDMTDNGDGTVRWHWREDHQIATYLMCVTVSRFAVSTLPYVRAPNDTVPVQYYTWPVDSAQVAAYLPTVRSMVSEFSRLYGAYPFDKYGMTGVVPFGYGGMEHQTITTLNRFVQTRERVVSHELAHQWWGDLVTCGSWNDVWLNESFATYSEALWREHAGGGPALRAYMKDTLEHFSLASWRGAVYDPRGQGFNLFDDVAYSKGAWVLHMLRGVVGDSTFSRILRAYRDLYAGRSAVTADLAAVVDSVVGTPMGWFFNQWVYGSGWPIYQLESTVVADTLLLTVRQTQQASWPTFRMPLTVRLTNPPLADVTYSFLDTARTQVVRIPHHASPGTIILDPDNRVLKQVGVLPGNGSPWTFNLLQNYPNPFNGETSIAYSLATRQSVTLTVYDVAGRLVKTLLRDTLPPGEYDASFDGNGCASGAYVCRLEAGGESRSIKMLLIR